MLGDANSRQMWQCLNNIKVMRPATCWLENVLGFVRVIDRVLAHISENLPEYEVAWLILDPLDHGSPITRRRVFIILILKEIMDQSVRGHLQDFCEATRERLRILLDLHWKDLLLDNWSQTVQDDIEAKQQLRKKNLARERQHQRNADPKWKQQHTRWAEENEVPERLARGTLQRMMPEAVEQVPTKREEKALDLILYRHGRPQAVNTSQNIYRMNPVFGHRAPLCVLTPSGRYLIGDLQRYLTGTEFLILMGVPMHRMSSDCCSQHELCRSGGNAIALRAAAVATIMTMKAADPALMARYLSN